MRKLMVVLVMSGTTLVFVGSHMATPANAQERMAGNKHSALTQEQLLYSFLRAPGNDHDPIAGLIMDATGNLYGTTMMGGDGEAGNVFELSPSSGGGWIETVLHSFKYKTDDGAYPDTNLVFDSVGNLYGATLQGGDNRNCLSTGGCGTVYELSPQAGGGWTEKVLWSFGGTDGDVPSGLVFDKAGNLFGSAAGGAYTYGHIFKLSPKSGGSWSERVIFSFMDSNVDHGENPSGGLIFDTAGNLYGTTQSGGSSGQGVVFRLSPRSHGNWAEKVLYAFKGNGKDGEDPYHAGVVFDTSGNLYGTTQDGGGGGCSSQGCGTVFELSPMTGGGWSEKVLYSFQSNGVDADYPIAGLSIDSAGNLYGTASGGTYNVGAVFEVSPQPGGGWTEQVLHSFMGGHHDGSYPLAGLTLDSAGNLYGTTQTGGVHDGGTVFELTP